MARVLVRGLSSRRNGPVVARIDQESAVPDGEYVKIARRLKRRGQDELIVSARLKTIEILQEIRCLHPSSPDYKFRRDEISIRQADPIRPDLDHTGFRTNVDPNPCRSRV